MPSSRKKRISRSARLRKYELSYEACIKKTLFEYKKKSKCTTPDKSHVRNEIVKERELSSEKNKEIKSSVKKVKKRLTESKKSKDRKRPLNTYQRFVRDESQKSKYKGMTSTERMFAISKVWKKIKDKNNMTDKL